MTAIANRVGMTTAHWMQERIFGFSARVIFFLLSAVARKNKPYAGQSIIGIAGKMLSQFFLLTSHASRLYIDVPIMILVARASCPFVADRDVHVTRQNLFLKSYSSKKALRWRKAFSGSNEVGPRSTQRREGIRHSPGQLYPDLCGCGQFCGSGWQSVSPGH